MIIILYLLQKNKFTKKLIYLFIILYSPKKLIDKTKADIMLNA